MWGGQYTGVVILPFLSKSSPTLAPLTDADRALAAALRRDVEILATDIGPRGTHAPKAYAIAEQFLTSALRGAGYEVERRVFEAMGVECANLVATLRGTQTNQPRRCLVVGAHYDSVEDCPAADDNASAVAGVLALARAMRHDSLPIDVRFVLFANEEPPFFNTNDMGSQRYARECRERGDDIVGMVCLEMIGYYSSKSGSQKWPVDALNLILPTTGDFICLVGPEASRTFIEHAAEAFEAQAAFPLVAAAAPDSIVFIHLSDHRGFNEAGYPAFMLTDTAFLRNPHYHRATDTPDTLDFDSMARVVRGTLGMVRALAAKHAR